MRALAVSGPRRLQVLPAVPTVAETIAGFAGESWQGLFAPRGPPPEVISTLSRLTRAILETAEFRGRLQELGLVPEGGTPEEFQTFIAEESPIWARVIRDNGITLDCGQRGARDGPGLRPRDPRPGHRQLDRGAVPPALTRLPPL